MLVQNIYTCSPTLDRTIVILSVTELEEWLPSCDGNSFVGSLISSLSLSSRKFKAKYYSQNHRDRAMAAELSTRFLCQGFFSLNAKLGNVRFLSPSQFSSSSTSCFLQNAPEKFEVLFFLIPASDFQSRSFKILILDWISFMYFKLARSRHIDNCGEVATSIVLLIFSLSPLSLYVEKMQSAYQSRFLLDSSILVAIIDQKRKSVSQNYFWSLGQRFKD